MNAEEVCKMIDQISEGKYYAHGFETVKDSHSLSIEVNEEFWISSFNASFLAKLDNPRTAREIAAALVAWANRKEGN